MFWGGFSAGIVLLLVAFYWCLGLQASSLLVSWQQVPRAYGEILWSIPILFLAVLAVILGKIFYETTVTFCLPKELTEKDNGAAGLYLAGFLLGLGIALTGCVLGLAKDSIASFLSILVGLILFLPLLRFSAWLHGKFLLRHGSVAKEICEDRNLGIAAVCCGAFIATGLILKSSFLGESPDLLCLVLSVLGAYLLGQAIFLLGGFLFQKMARYDFYHEIEERDNLSAGILFGSFLVSVGLVVSPATTGITTTKAILGQLGFALFLGILGILLLLGLGLLAAKLLFPYISLDAEVKQKNPAVAFVLSAVYLTVALLINMMLLNP